jgi:hypothetical protein
MDSKGLSSGDGATQSLSTPCNGFSELLVYYGWVILCRGRLSTPCNGFEETRKGRMENEETFNSM